MLWSTSYAVQVSIALCGIIISSLSYAASAQGAGGLTINTPPSLISCQPASITWSGAQPPVYLSVLKGGDLSSAPLRQFPEQNSAQGSYPWTVDLGSGTSVTLQIRDGTGQTQASAPVNILSGPDNKQCTGGGSGGGSSGPSNASSPSGGASPSSSSSSSSSAPSNKSSTAKNNTAPAAPASTMSSTPASASTNATTSTASSPGNATKKNSGSIVSYDPAAVVLIVCVSVAAILC